jgi:hypothetical protein
MKKILFYRNIACKNCSSDESLKDFFIKMKMIQDYILPNLIFRRFLTSSVKLSQFVKKREKCNFYKMDRLNSKKWKMSILSMSSLVGFTPYLYRVFCRDPKIVDRAKNASPRDSG